MRIKAKVIKAEGNIAIVESERLSACEGCHKHAEGCSVCSLMGSNKIISAKAKNTLGAKCGDVVEIETETKTVLLYALLVFVLPVVVMLLLYAVAAGLRFSEKIRYICALCGFVLAFAGLWIYSKFCVAKKCDAEIVSIIERKNQNGD